MPRLKVWRRQALTFHPSNALLTMEFSNSRLITCLESKMSKQSSHKKGVKPYDQYMIHMFKYLQMSRIGLLRSHLEGLKSASKFFRVILSAKRQPHRCGKTETCTSSAPKAALAKPAALDAWIQVVHNILALRSPNICII